MIPHVYRVDIGVEEQQHLAQRNVPAFDRFNKGSGFPWIEQEISTTIREQRAQSYMWSRASMTLESKFECIT